MEEWQTASHEDTQSFISRVKAPDYGGLFNASYMRLHYYPLNFYEGGKLILLENLISQPPFSLDYIEAGETLVYMDGSAKPFEELNKAGLLRLTPDTAIDYLRTYLSYVTPPHVKIYLLQYPERLPYQDSFFIDFNFDKNSYSEADIKLARNETDNGYIVTAPFVFGGKIDRGIALIGDDGSVSVEKEAGR
jgi:hypothetical protein